MSINGVEGRLTYFAGNSASSAGEQNSDNQDTQISAKPSSISLAESPEYGRSNLMAGNFADPNPEKSKYLLATMKSFETERSFKNKLDSIVSLLKAGLDEDNKYTQATLTSIRAKRHLQQIQNEEIVEESKERLKKDREGLSEAAQGEEAALEANGNPVAAATSGDTGSAPANSAETAPTAKSAVAAAEVSVDIVV
jgi:hypothetical protein